MLLDCLSIFKGPPRSSQSKSCWKQNIDGTTEKIKLMVRNTNSYLLQVFFSLILTKKLQLNNHGNNQCSGSILTKKCDRSGHCVTDDKKSSEKVGLCSQFMDFLCMVSILSSVYIYLRCLKGLGNTYPNLGVLLYICRANESFHSKRGKILPSLPVSTLLYRRLVYPNFPSQTSEAVKQSPSVRMSSMESRLLRTHGGCGERLLIG